MPRRYLVAALVLVVMAATGALTRLYVDGAWPALVPSTGPDFSYGPLAEALGNVDPAGRIDFDALKKNRAPLDAFVTSLERFSPDATPERFKEPTEQLAYWVNAYNALVLQALVDRWPGIQSPDDLWLGRFYWGLSWPVGGQRLTLRAIVDHKLREGVGDPRALLAVHCGALGCGALDSTPYMGDTIDGQLNDAARRFMAEKQNVRIDGKTIHLSPLLQQYQPDFVGALPTGRTHFLQFVWAFMPDSCNDRPGCDTRGDLDKACGPKFEACTVAWEPWASGVRKRAP